MTRLHYAATTDSDQLYLLQHNISDPVFFLDYRGKQYVFLSHIDFDAFSNTNSTAVEPLRLEPFLEKLPSGYSRASALAINILSHFKVIGPVAVPQQFPIGLADDLRTHGFSLNVITPFCPERELKSDAEILKIEKNMQVTCGAFDIVRAHLAAAEITEGVLTYEGEPLTSEYLSNQLEIYFLEHGLRSTAGMIVSCGVHSAMPHHHGTGPLLPHQPIIVDLFPQSRHNHYFADMTRTFVKGEPSAQLTRTYETVLAAQQAVLKILKPGLPCKEAYEITAAQIQGAGFTVGDTGFTHSLGHGLGVAVHESPTLGPRSEATLQPGHVVTIEPGIYEPGFGGVRIEDTVLITEDGYRNLTQYGTERWVIA